MRSLLSKGLRTFWRWAFSGRAVALVGQGQGEEWIAQIHRGLLAYQAIGAELYRPGFLALLAEAYGKVGQTEEGLHAAGRSVGVGRQNWGAWLRGRAVSAERAS